MSGRSYFGNGYVIILDELAVGTEQLGKIR